MPFLKTEFCKGVKIMNECNEDAFRHENMSFNGRTSLVPLLKKKQNKSDEQIGK